MIETENFQSARNTELTNIPDIRKDSLPQEEMVDNIKDP
jgi:hypothetical protein